ncbi:MAG: class I SAM-dependent methyltransferase [Acidobacteriota bacterium]|nr:class I SAM-dependent methyltransferase [Acidobacteriota bacterium]
MRCEHKRRTRSAEYPGLTLWTCRDCGFVFSDRWSGGFDPKKLYDSFYDQNEIVGRFHSPVEIVIRLFRLFRAFKIWTIRPGARSILDIGSGRGFMLYYLKRFFGYRRAAGTQISRGACEFSRRTLGLEMYHDDLPECGLEGGSFEVVTLWHVLEHILDPEGYLEEIKRLLVPGGRLVVEVPNFLSWTKAYTGLDWLGLDPDYHVHFFTPEALTAALRKHGYRVRLVHTFSLEYSAFISTQSLISKWTRTPNLVFRALQTAGEGQGQGKRPERVRMGRTLPLFAALFPLCLIANLLLFGTKRGEVLLVVADSPAVK